MFFMFMLIENFWLVQINQLFIRCLNWFTTLNRMQLRTIIKRNITRGNVSVAGVKKL